MNWRMHTIVLMICSLSAKADYDSFQLYEMILSADKIVYGEIIGEDSVTFTLRVDKNLTGEEKLLKINKHQNWTCAWRWTQYEVGQNVLLFLKEQNGALSQMGPGNESELPIQENDIFLNTFALSSFPKFQDSLSDTIRHIMPQKHIVYDATYQGFKFQKSKFVEAIVIIRKCYEVKSWHKNRITSVKRVCEESHLDMAHQSQNNPILRLMINELDKMID